LGQELTKTWRSLLISYDMIPIFLEGWRIILTGVAEVGSQTLRKQKRAWSGCQTRPGGKEIDDLLTSVDELIAAYDRWLG